MRDMERIYKEHAKSVYKYLLSLCQDGDLAEELTQETFYRALYSLHTYNGACKVSVWLCQIAKHIWYQELEKRRKTRAMPLTEQIPAPGISPEEKALLAQEKLALYQTLHALEDPIREVMYLRLSGEFSFREIGEILGKNENWARITFYRGKRKITKEK